MKSLYAAIFSLFVLMLTSAAFAAPVNINTADVKVLDQQLDGVGPKSAKAIVDYRTKNGPFKSVDDLSKVKGIGKATVEKNRKNIVVGEK
jgi:competence protein ComEA